MMNSVCHTRAWALLGYVTSRCSGQAFWSVRPGKYSEVGWDVIWLPCQCGGKSSCRASKAVCLRSQIRQTCTLPSSLIRLFHVLALPMSKVTGWDCTWVLQVGTHSAKIQVLIIASLFFPLLSQSDSQYLSTTEILQSLWDTTRVEVPKKWSRMLSELNVHPGLSFLIGGTVGSGEASWHGTPPTWERSSAVAPALAQLCTIATPLF